MGHHRARPGVPRLDRVIGIEVEPVATTAVGGGDQRVGEDRLGPVLRSRASDDVPDAGQRAEERQDAETPAQSGRSSSGHRAPPAHEDSAAMYGGGAIMGSAMNELRVLSDSAIDPV